MDFPVWATTKEILAYCRDKRGLALRYALVPVVLVILMDAGAILAGIDIGEDRVWLLASTVVALLIYAPFLVTWYLSVAVGEDEARARPLFTFGQREGAVVLTNVLVAILVAIALIGLGGIVALVSAGVAQVNEIAGQATAVVLGVPAGLAWLMVFTRLSVIIAYAAVGRHLGIRDCWRLTRPIALPFTAVHIILGAIGLGIAGAAVAGTNAIVEAAGGEGGVALSLAVSIADTLFGIVYLLLSTTLFGVVYRRLAQEPL